MSMVIIIGLINRIEISKLLSKEYQHMYSEMFLFVFLSLIVAFCISEKSKKSRRQGCHGVQLKKQNLPTGLPGETINPQLKGCLDGSIS